MINWLVKHDKYKLRDYVSIYIFEMIFCQKKLNQ